MSEKKTTNQIIHDVLRTLQWLLPALVTFYGVLDEVFGWGLMDPISRIVTALVALIGVIAQHGSKVYFEKHVVHPVEMSGEEIAALEETYEHNLIKRELTKQEREAGDE